MNTLSKYITEKLHLNKDIKLFSVSDEVIKFLGIDQNYKYYNDIINIFDDYFNTYNINNIKDHKLNIYSNEEQENTIKHFINNKKILSKIQFLPRFRTRTFRLKSQHLEFRVFDKDKIYIYRNEKTLIFISINIDLIFNYE